MLLHPTSLPSRFGIGDFGPAARRFIDGLSRARQTWWQMLPLGPPGEGNSPYMSYSAMAGNPALISPELLIHDGLLSAGDLRHSPRFSGQRVDYESVVPWKTRLLEQAWERFRRDRPASLVREFAQFRKTRAGWLDAYALFMAIKESQAGRAYLDWPEELRNRRPAAVERARQEHSGSILRHQFIQFLFFRQLAALRAYGLTRGVKLLGDLPIFVSGDSADVWAHPELFLLDKDRRPKVVAGVPPDFFSRTGQRWGNPLYDWRAMKRDGYRWWIARFATAMEQADLVRIDHFRGFAACWQVPAHFPDARQGSWRQAPGHHLFEAVRQHLGSLPFVAEDLGLITPDVEALRKSLGLPGMRILQFAFGGNAANPYLPHNHERNAVAYTGTHDNDTTGGWLARLPSRQKRHLLQYLGEGTNDIVWRMIRLAWSSVARYAIVPLQDLLELDSSARMNIPGSTAGNWRWRFQEDQLGVEHWNRLAELTRTYGRVCSRPHGVESGEAPRAIETG